MTSQAQAGLTDRQSFIKAVGAAAVALGTGTLPAVASAATLVRFGDKAAGPAEQLGKLIDAAKIVRSPIVRAVLGSAMNRRDGMPQKNTD